MGPCAAGVGLPASDFNGANMIHPQAAVARKGRGRRRGPFGLVFTLAAALCIQPVAAQAPAAPVAASPAPVAEELEGLVGRIALYPDDLVAIILPASTNPLQIVQADRYLQKRKADPKAPIDEKWDDSVKSLLNYPDVVKTMSDDLDWTSALGEAVVADAGAVLEAVQGFRRKAQAAGNLKTDDKQTVQVEKEVITIVQSNPEVIYVPQYNPTTVVYAGYAGWGYYPTPYPVYYYPYAPGAAFATGLIWGAAIGAAWNGGRYGANYGGNNNININRDTDINIGGGDRGGGSRGDGGRGGASTSQWKSNKQPGQVSSSVGKTAPSSRAGDARGGGAQAGGGGARPSAQPAGGAGARPSAQPSGGGGAGAGTRPSAQPSGGGAGGASASNRASPSGGSAFSGYDSGRQTSMDSSRGASSRSSASSSASRPSPSAGARSSGGGARSGGGGGGGRRR
ncbi:MAG: DUF3300 domain-containing protein [Rubrivivax sp.]|nr:DUF3300 domain-containing protein [Rubrivivax sp.]